MNEFDALKAAFCHAEDAPLMPLLPGSAQARVVEPYFNRYGLTPLWCGAAHVYAGFIESGRFSLWCQVWSPRDPVGSAFVMHGYFDHLGLYRHLLARLLARGWQVVLWDLPGHGLSSGERATIDDFDDYRHCLHAVQAALTAQTLVPAPWVGIGQSTGAAILATDALRRQDAAPWAGLALLAPLVRPQGWRQASAMHRLVSPFVRSVARRYRSSSTDSAFVDFLRQQDPLQSERLSLIWVSAMRRWMPQLLAQPPSTLPVLMIQGEQDHTVDWPYNLDVLAKKFPRAEVYRHPLARHHLVNEAEPIREALFARLERFLDELC
jgi:alpha-beta hydrolase superfamily lysophospholipase